MVQSTVASPFQMIGKVALITGGSKGIGGGCARVFHAWIQPSLRTKFEHTSMGTQQLQLEAEVAECSLMVRPHATSAVDYFFVGR